MLFCDGEFFYKKYWEILRPRLEKGKNLEYWVKKIQRNRQRDVEKDQTLQYLGWTVLHFLGKDIRNNPDECVRMIEEIIFEQKVENVEEELCQVKKKEITVPAQESIIKEGWKPDQFRSILQKAIGKLRGFIQFMNEIRNGEFDTRGNPLIRHDLKFDVTPAPLPESAKGERPSSALQEAEVMRLDRILQKMKKAEQEIYAIEKAKLRLEKDLKVVQKKWFHGKEKKELEQKITGKRQELKRAQETLNEIPKMQGYENALEVKKAYNTAVTELEGVRKLQSEWDQKGIPEKKYWVIKANVPGQTKQKSIYERLEEKKRDVEQKQKKERKRSHGRDFL